MSTHLTFRLSDDLSAQLKKYCSDNKLNTTEAMNIAVQKLVSRQDGGSAVGQANNVVVDETFVLVESMYSFIVKYIQNTLPDIELENKLSKLSGDAWVHLQKIKKEQ